MPARVNVRKSLAYTVARLRRTDPRKAAAGAMLGIVGALTAFTIAVALLVGAPRKTPRLADLGAWSTAPVPVRTPLALSEAAKLWLMRADIALHEAYYRDVAPPAPRELIESAYQPPLGRVERIVMTSPRFWLGPPRVPRSGPAGGDDPKLLPLLEPMLRMAFSSLRIDGGQIMLQRPAGGLLTVDKLHLTLSNSTGSEGRRATGQLALLGEMVSFKADLQPAVAVGTVWRLPARVVASSRHFKLGFDGALQVESGLPRLFGRLTLDGPSLHGLARWLGTELSARKGALEGFTVKADMTWRDATLTLEQADVTIDGQQMRGTAALGLATARPFLDGALAMETLDAPRLLRWLGFDWPGGSDGPRGHEGGSARLALFDGIDADLRVSGARLAGLPPSGSHVALSLTAKGGEVVADVAELEIGGGIGAGQARIDQRSAVTQMSIRGALQNASVSPILSLLGSTPTPFLDGWATLRLDVSGRGKTLPELLRSLTGEAQVSIPNGGRIQLDPKALMSDVRDRRVMDLAAHGWRAADFAALDARLAIRNGIVLTEHLSLRSEGTLVTADGRFSTPTNSIYLRLLMDHGHGLARTARLGRSQTVVILGELPNPMVMVEEPAAQAAATVTIPAVAAPAR